MADYDINAGEMGYRFLVFMALAAMFGAAMRTGNTTVPENSILKPCCTDTMIAQMATGAIVIQLGYAVIALLNVLVGTSEALRRMRDTYYSILAFPAAVLFTLASLSKNIEVNPNSMSDNMPLSNVLAALVARRDYVIFVTMLVETWFFDRKFYSLFDDATRLAILATLGGGVCAATNKLAVPCALETFGILFGTFLLLAVVFRFDWMVCAICQVEGEIPESLAPMTPTPAVRRSSRTHTQTATLMSDDEDEITFSARKPKTTRARRSAPTTPKSSTSSRASSQKATPSRRGRKKAEVLLSDDEDHELTEEDIPKALRINNPGPKSPHTTLSATRLRQRSSRK